MQSAQDRARDILDLFAEAAHQGRRRHRKLDGFRIFPGPLPREDIAPARAGEFCVPLPPYARRPHGAEATLITRAPCWREWRTCAECGGVVEWREGLTRRQGYHIGSGAQGGCPGSPVRHVDVAPASKTP